MCVDFHILLKSDEAKQKICLHYAEILKQKKARESCGHGGQALLGEFLVEVCDRFCLTMCLPAGRTKFWKNDLMFHIPGTT